MTDNEKSAARLMGAEFATVPETAAALQVSEETIRGYLSDPEFSAEIASQRDAAERVSEERVQAEARAAFGMVEETL